MVKVYRIKGKNTKGSKKGVKKMKVKIGTPLGLLKYISVLPFSPQ